MTDSPTGRLAVITAASGLALLAAGLVLIAAFDLEEKVADLLRWIEAREAWAPAIFIAIMALVTFLMLPGQVLTIGAGFVFGIVQGTAYVVIGTTLGATGAFLAARHLAGARAERFLWSHKRLALVNRRLAHAGWRIVLLTRLIPLFPGKLSNYAFGLAGYPLGGFGVGTLVGLIPFSLHHAYLGSMVGRIATGDLRPGPQSPVEWAAYGGGFLAIVAATVYIGGKARRALASYASQEEREGAGRSCRG